MRHGNAHRKLNRTAEHRAAMFANMAAALIKHEQITTTLPKAKDLRPIVEKLVTLGKRGDLHARRQAIAQIKDITIDKLDHGHRGVVAVAEAGLDDAGVATLAILVAGRERVEQLAHLLEIAHLADRLTAHREPALLAERHQLLHDRAQFLRLRQRGDDLLVLDQRGAHVGEHRAAMLGGAVELAMNLAVTHFFIP